MPLVEVRFGQNTVWLGIQQMADIFGRDKPVISRNLKKISCKKANYCAIRLLQKM